MENFTEILEKLSPIITVIVSAVISYIVAKINAKNEIKKTLMSFSREDKQSMNQAFTKMMTKTEQFCCFSCMGNSYDSIEATTHFLTLAPKEFHPLLLEMHEALQNNDRTKIQVLRKKLLELYSEIE